MLRFDKGEEVIAGLQDYLAKSNIKAAQFWGIGSTNSFELGYFNGTLKDYRKKPFFDEREILTFTGNGAMLDGKPVVHAHGSFSDFDFQLVGGHVFSLKVSATCEIFLIAMEGEADRKNNPDFNLNLLT